MKTKSKKCESPFIPYDDNSLEHNKNCPDYGQTWRITQSAWLESDSIEYSEFVEDIKNKILGNNIKLPR